MSRSPSHLYNESQLLPLSSSHLTSIMHNLKLPTTGITLKSQKIAAILSGTVTQEIKDMRDTPRPPPHRSRPTRSLHKVAENCPVDKLPSRTKVKKNYRIEEAMKMEPPLRRVMIGMANQRPLPNFNTIPTTLAQSESSVFEPRDIVTPRVATLFGQQGLVAPGAAMHAPTLKDASESSITDTSPEQVIGLPKAGSSLRQDSPLTTPSPNRKNANSMREKREPYDLALEELFADDPSLVRQYMGLD